MATEHCAPVPEPVSDINGMLLEFVNTYPLPRDTISKSVPNTGLEPLVISIDDPCPSTTPITELSSASFAAPIESASILGGSPITNLQGVTGDFTNHSFTDTGSFSGSMQEYRGWIEEIDQSTFDLHTKNPTSYVSSLTPSSSFDTLIRHYTLGTNAIAFDCSTDTIFTSSHPN